MKKLLVMCLLLGIVSTSHAQLKKFLPKKEDKEESGEKKKKLSLGERIGNVTGNLMTSKTDRLDGVVAKINYICGMYPTYLNTSETKYLPEGTYEGDYLLSVSFLKGDGIGMYEVAGNLSAEGQDMDYVGLGSFGTKFPIAKVTPVELQINTEGGDQANFILNPIPGVDIISVNEETSLPILDLSEDLVLEYNNPAGSEGTTLRVSLLTDVMGARALNHFADFEITEAGRKKVTIPKEALANPEIAGQLNAGQFNKGENYLILERVKILNKEDYPEGTSVGDLSASDITIKSFATMPVIVKGKQEEGIITNLKVRYKSPDKKNQYQFNKPNANYGIPFSEASRFGLVSFTMSARTFHQETETSTSYGPYYVTTTTTTTTLEFPQLPDDHWEYVMENIYQDVVEFFKTEYNVEFVPVENVTQTSQYENLFTADQGNTYSEVKMSYKGTKRNVPQGFSEIFGSASTNFTADNPTVNMMKDAGDLDGLVSMNMNLAIAENSAGNIILVPSFQITIQGRDEGRNDKLGTYVDGYILRSTGEPFNAEMVKANKDDLLRVCSFDQIMLMTKDGLQSLREKEVEMGYDRIWSIGEE